MPTPIQTITYRARDGKVYENLADAIRADHRHIVKDTLQEFRRIRGYYPPSRGDILTDLMDFMAQHDLTITSIDLGEEP